MRTRSLGRSFFGVAVAASGVLQLVTGKFVRLVPTAAGGVDAPSAWPYVVGVALLAAGGAMFSDRTARVAGSVVAGMILVSLAVRQLPQAVTNPWAGFMWTNPLKGLALMGGAVLVAGTWTWRGDETFPRGREAGGVERLGAVLLAVFLVVCGVQHFVYSDFVTTLVPTWIPGRRLWTYFTGVALIAGGMGMLVRPTARLAAMLSGVMIFLWVLMLHIPRAVAGPNHANETAGIFEALAVSGIAFMLAGTHAWRRDDEPSGDLRA